MRLFLAGVSLAVCALGCTVGDDFVAKPAAADASPGGTIRIAITEPSSIDPATTSAHDPSGSLVVRTICDPLIALDAQTGEPVGAVAESWLVTDGGRKVTVKLRKQVMFHDGTELTAADVVFSLSRVADIETASPVAELLQPVAGWDALRGDRDENTEVFGLSGAEVIETYSFEVSLTEAGRNADFYRVLTHTLASPVPQRVVESDPSAFERKPVCAGPYRLTKPFAAGDEVIRVERFNGYHAMNGAYSAGGAGYADAIEFRIYPDRAAAVNAWVAGEVDVTAVPRSSIADVRTLGQAVEGVTPTLEYLGLPTTTPPFDEVAVRRAFSMAIDRTALAADPATPERTPADRILPATVGDSYGRGCGIESAADVDGARALLERADIDLTGREIGFHFSDEFENRQTVTAIASQLSAAFGIAPRLVGAPFEQFVVIATTQDGFPGPFRYGISPEFASADAYLDPLFNATRIGQTNLSRFNNVAFEGLLRRGARRAEDDEDRAVGYQRVEELACAQMPIVPLTFGGRVYAVKPAVGNAIAAGTERATGAIAPRELFVAS